MRRLLSVTSFEAIGLDGQASMPAGKLDSTIEVSPVAKSKLYARAKCSLYSVFSVLAGLAIVVLLVQSYGRLFTNTTVHAASQTVICMSALAARPALMLLCTHAVLGMVLFLLCLKRKGKKAAYLVDFYSFRPPSHMQGTNMQLVQGYEKTGLQSAENLGFIRRICDMSGLGEQTFMPADVWHGISYDLHKRLTYEGTRRVTETALFVSIEQLLEKTKLQPHQIDGLIINCCNFTTVPSLASAVVNHFKLKPSVLSYNLSGMGCAATVIATDLANELLQNHKKMRIVIASSENIHQGIYQGKQRSMLISNLIFRYGGVAFLMSNHPADKALAKYELKHIVRTHLGADDTAYRCVMEQSDEEGRVGNKIGKELMGVAGKALALNIRTLAPLVLPLSEQLAYGMHLFQRKVLKRKMADHKPDFGKAFEHFCIHTGGKAVIKSVEQNLKLKPGQGQPCRATFERYGNTSSTSTWYNWSYVETFTGVKKGDRVWQLSFGSGFKVASAVWTALRPINTQHDALTETPSC